MMGSNILAGSENLYKYLVSIGMLLIVLTVYYPLKEKQELVISKIELEGEVKILNYRINENKSNVDNLQSIIKGKELDSRNQESLSAITKINYENNIHQLECEQKYSEINAKENQIRLYNILFWIFLPVGVCITIWGFYKWVNAKQTEDNKAKEELKQLQKENNAQ